jgi:hypothetical protein
MPIQQLFETGFGDQFVSVLASADGLGAPRHVDLQTALYPVQRLFPPGLFAGTHVGGKHRLLPRALAFASGSGQPVIGVRPFMAGLFVPGDVITVINLPAGTAGAAVGTVQSVNTQANTITLTAALGSAIAADTVIGVATSIPVGMLCPNTAIDAGNFERPNSEFGAFTRANIVRARMPYWDTQLAALPGCLYTIREVP